MSVATVAGVVGYSLGASVTNVAADSNIEYSTSSYEWGVIGRGCFCDPETRDILNVEECNEIDVARPDVL